MRRIIFACVVLFGNFPSLYAAAPDFDRTVAPILAGCLDCHSGPTAKGGLNMASRDKAMSGGKNGIAIKPGKLDASLLWSRVESDEMPPKKPLSIAEKAILKSWIETGAKWGSDPIDVNVHSSTTRSGRDWWSLQPLPRTAKPGRSIDYFIDLNLQKAGLKPAPPADKRTLIRRLKYDLLGLPPTPEEVAGFLADTSVDAYANLVERYLASPQYGERWARHWLDAVRFAESNGFETNTIRPNAWHYRDWVIRSFNDDKPYDRFVLEQLAGDTTGADAGTGFLVAGASDQVKSPDVVLTSNQRADELHDIVSTVGSTFLGMTIGCARCHAHKFDPISQEDYYRVKAVFSGVHHGERTLLSANATDVAEQIGMKQKRLAALEAERALLEPLADPQSNKPRRMAVNSRTNIERFTPTEARFLRFTILTTNNDIEPCLDELEVFTTDKEPKNIALASAGTKATSLGDYAGSPEIHRLAHINDGKFGNSYSWISNTNGRGTITLEFTAEVTIERIAWGRDREERYQDRTAQQYKIEVSRDGKSWQTVASSEDRAKSDSEMLILDSADAEAREAFVTKEKHILELRAELALLQRSERAYLGTFSKPEPVHRLHRGDPMEKRELIAPGVLQELALSATIAADAPDSARRAAFAQWIIHPENPLPARVMANRIWQHHFGTGLVATSSDFGFNGGRPSHPELLDWLARTFIDEKWSIKSIHRLIVRSNAYRRSSSITREGLQVDASSRLLWRYPARRIEAEVIRDSILAASGKLDLKAGGPGFDLFEPNTNYVKVYKAKTQFGPAEFRRMIYQQKPRMQLDNTFGVFDCPDAGQIAPKRNLSTTPLQAFNLLNSPFIVQQAGFFAERVQKAEAEDTSTQVRRTFQIAFQRDPTAQEADAAVKLVESHGLAALCRALFNTNEFLYVD